MKKIALMLALVLVMSASMCVFASAETVITVSPVVYYGVDADGNVNISDETNMDNDMELTVPSDMVAVAIEFDTAGIGFAAYTFDLVYDTAKFQLLGIDYDNWALTAEATDIQAFGKGEMGDFDNAEPFGGTTPVLPITAYAVKENRISIVDGSENNYKSKGKNITTGVAAVFYFEVITDEACDATFSITGRDIATADEVGYDVTGTSTTIKLNGGAPEAAAPVVSLGAKVNAELTGIRFGATYNKVEENGVVADLGMLLLPAAKLGDDTLDLDYAASNALVAKVRARAIEGYVEGQNFEDYATFNFYVTLLGLTGHEDADIVAVPYIVYDNGTEIYGDAIIHSFNSASEAANA